MSRAGTLTGRAQPAPFDRMAASYDAEFTNTPLGRALRAAVWERLEAAFPPGSCALELACGTGEDARHLSGRGVRVLATDQSEEMLEIARQKCAGLSVEFARLDLNLVGSGDWGLPDPATSGRCPNRTPPGPAGSGDRQFDGAFSNFGGLNFVADLRPVAGFLAGAVRPGGRLVLVVMGRWCAWEVVWYLAHGRPRTAFRRLGPVRARMGGGGAWGCPACTVHYPTAAGVRRAFAPFFRLRRARPLGLFLPPSYLEPLTRRACFPLRAFGALDRLAPRPLWGDHTLYEFMRAG